LAKSQKIISFYETKVTMTTYRNEINSSK
jgi:hypothetical protein